MAVRAICIDSFVDRMPFRSIAFHIVAMKMKKMIMPLKSIFATRNTTPIPNGGYTSIMKNKGTIKRIAITWNEKNVVVKKGVLHQKKAIIKNLTHKI